MFITGTVGTVATFADNFSSITDTAGDVVSSIGNFLGFGGGSRCTKEKLEQRKKVEDALRQYTTYSERKAYIESTGSSTSRIKPTPEGMAYFYMGEDDCFHRNVSAKHERFINGLPQWVQQKANEKSNQSPTGSQPQSARVGQALPLISVLGAVAYFLMD